MTAGTTCRFKTVGENHQKSSHYEKAGSREQNFIIESSHFEKRARQNKISANERRALQKRSFRPPKIEIESSKIAGEHCF